jgi:hypothetical protein
VPELYVFSTVRSLRRGLVQNTANSSSKDEILCEVPPREVSGLRRPDLTCAFLRDPLKTHAHPPHVHVHSGPLVSFASDQASCLRRTTRPTTRLTIIYDRRTQCIRGV